MRDYIRQRAAHHLRTARHDLRVTCPRYAGIFAVYRLAASRAFSAGNVASARIMDTSRAHLIHTLAQLARADLAQG